MGAQVFWHGFGVNPTNLVGIDRGVVVVMGVRIFGCQKARLCLGTESVAQARLMFGYYTVCFR